MKMKKGFTIVELLAVIAILGILATIGGVSVFGVVSKMRTKALEDGLSSLKEASITYIQSKNVFLDSCSTDFDPKEPGKIPENKNCYKVIRYQEIVDEQLFDPGQLTCYSNKIIVVYRYQQGAYTELTSYLEDGICEF